MPGIKIRKPGLTVTTVCLQEEDVFVKERYTELLYAL